MVSKDPAPFANAHLAYVVDQDHEVRDPDASVSHGMLTGLEWDIRAGECSGGRQLHLGPLRLSLDATTLLTPHIGL